MKKPLPRGYSRKSGFHTTGSVLNVPSGAWTSQIMGRRPYLLATELVLVSNRCYSCIFTINNGSSGLLWIFCLTSLRAGMQIYNKRF